MIQLTLKFEKQLDVENIKNVSSQVYLFQSQTPFQAQGRRQDRELKRTTFLSS